MNRPEVQDKPMSKSRGHSLNSSATGMIHSNSQRGIKAQIRSAKRKEAKQRNAQTLPWRKRKHRGFCDNQLCPCKFLFTRMG